MDQRLPDYAGMGKRPVFKGWVCVSTGMSPHTWVYKLLPRGNMTHHQAIVFGVEYAYAFPELIGSMRPVEGKPHLYYSPDGVKVAKPPNKRCIPHKPRYVRRPKS